MADPHHPSSPIKRSVPPTDARSATQTEYDIDRSGIVQKIACEDFRKTYLLKSSHKSWIGHEESYVSQIRNVPKAEEIALYTGHAPLLRLLNSMSKNVANNGQKALVFRAGHKCRVNNPFADQHRHPDIVVQWEQSNAFQQIDYSEYELSPKIWTQLAAVGEVKVSAPAESQLAGYLQNHLRFHPELNAALGFSIRATGYALFYHDAAVVHQSDFEWEPGPLYEFIDMLYTRPFQDPSMQIQSSEAPRWATKIGNDVYFSGIPNTPGGPDAQGGPGQRRYTTEAQDQAKNEIFIKDIWRAQGRFFFEGLLLKRAHEDTTMCGLIQPSSYGYVGDTAGKPIRTTRFNPGSDTKEFEALTRFKMRMVTKEIGQPLEGVHSLRKFLCAMYDACAVQRNLYRRCKILHRDISDKNIMFAPNTEAYRERNRSGYAQVKFVNQVLARGGNADPAPACLMIDLGNGADLEIKRGKDALTERTGTPKFIARSVSSGKLLNEDIFSSARVKMPLMEGVLADYHRFMDATGYQADSPGSNTQSEFAHRLFHDAESTFWVIAWTLARSIQAGSEQEKEPHIMFSQFFHTMSKHYPIPGGDDSRHTFTYTTKEEWESVLHPDLAVLAPMLASMFKYIRPEWAYHPELNAEHVHEALMRLLLIEIINIKNGTDIDIHIGGRDSPPPPLGQDLLPRSITGSRTKSLAHSQKSRSVGPHTSNASGAGSGSVGSSKRKHESFSAASETSDSSKRTRANTSDGPAARTRLRTALAQPQEQESNLVWSSGPCTLQEPRSHGEVNVDPPSSGSSE